MQPTSLESMNEVRALHRMLYKRKFEGPFDEFFGSPFIADIQRRLLATMAAEIPGDWEAWAEAGGHESALNRLREYLSTAKWWNEADPDLRQTFVADCLAPLTVSDTLMAELVALRSGDDQ